MYKGLFRYNPKTCRYEPAPFPAGKVLGWLFFLFICSSLCFFAYGRLQAWFFPTEYMQSLQRENYAYNHHSQKMRSELIGLKRAVALAEEHELKLLNKIFGEYPKDHQVVSQSTVGTENAFDAIKSLKKQINAILQATDSGEEVFLPGPISGTTWALSWPVHSGEPVIASGFGVRIHPFHKGKYFHTGLDIPAVKGTEVLAAGKGRISRVVNNPLESGLGNYVEIVHTEGLLSRYACLQNITVRSGQLVDEGAVIGYAGTSGSAVAPHVHFEVLVNERPVNPMLLLVKGFSAHTYARLLEESNARNQSLD